MIEDWLYQQEQSMLNEPAQEANCEPCGTEGVTRLAVGDNSDGSPACNEHLLPD